MEYRDRTEMKFVVDEHLQLVLEYIQLNVPVAKLIGVSERLPELARLLVGSFPAGACVCRQSGVA